MADDKNETENVRHNDNNTNDDSKENVKQSNPAKQDDKETTKKSEETAPSSKTVDKPLLRILTVGDGDFTFTLALCRAYGSSDSSQKQHPQVVVTGTTLLSNETELYQTYDNSRDVVKELKEIWNAQVLFGVDA
eukprot:9331998-Ditylum_brightwellii.AAC.1